MVRVRKPVSGLGSACLLALALLAVAQPEPVMASPIQFAFQGTVEASTISGINPGDPFTGTLSYDPDLSRREIQDLNVGVYEVTGPSDRIQLRVEVGSQTFEIDDPGFAGIMVARGEEIWGSSLYDTFMTSISDTTGRKEIGLLMSGSAGEAFTSTDLPEYMDMSMFSSGSLLSYSDNTQIDPDTWSGASFGGPLTSITPIPEPSVLAVFTLAILGYGLRRLGRGAVADRASQ